ncbi:S-adenosylmethionine:tRNA ribosyltransferase-isomerase, partial [Aeromonas veronii]|nr:S-adenosylmethionine:tRNA ribosyltransferase-isomerase [Aeromonas veronii]
VIAVGTTVVRALETFAISGALSGVTNLYINEHFPLRIADGIITGLHEPKASHLDMLSAFISKQHLLQAYDHAIDAGYLWHEFGDMNLII